jgi:hypothetical protein
MENSSIEEGKQPSRIEIPRSNGQDTDRPLPELDERLDCNEQQRNDNAFYSDLQDTNEICLLYLHLGSGDEQTRCTVTNAKSFKRPFWGWLGGRWRRMGWTVAILDPNHLPGSRRLPRFSLAHEFHCVDRFNLVLRVLSWAGGEWKDVVEVLIVLMGLESGGVCLLLFIFNAVKL